MPRYWKGLVWEKGVKGVLADGKEAGSCSRPDRAGSGIYPNTKLYPLVVSAVGAEGSAPVSGGNGVERTLSDRIASILLKNSSLSRVQAETMLIQVLSNESPGRRLKSGEKGVLRTDRAKVSRGSFNRSLYQAKRNVMRSICTVFLLAYLGILDTPELEAFVEAGSRLRSEMEKVSQQGVGVVESASEDTLTEHLSRLILRSRTTREI